MLTKREKRLLRKLKIAETNMIVMNAKLNENNLRAEYAEYTSRARPNVRTEATLERNAYRHSRTLGVRIEIDEAIFCDMTKNSSIPKDIANQVANSVLRKLFEEICRDADRMRANDLERIKAQKYQADMRTSYAPGSLGYAYDNEELIKKLSALGSVIDKSKLLW